MNKIQIMIRTFRRNESVMRKLRKTNKDIHSKLYAEQRKECSEIVENLVRSGKIMKDCSHAKLKSWKCNEERVCRGHLMCMKCGEKRIQFSYELPLLEKEIGLISKHTRRIYKKYDVYRNNKSMVDEVATRARF